MRRLFFSRCPACSDERYSHGIEFPELLFVRCQGCQLIYKREHAPAIFQGYDEQYFRFNRAKYLKRWEHRVQKCRRQLLNCLEHNPSAESMLDIGCSAGYVLEAARSLGLREMGVDISEFAVNLCRERGYRAELGSLMNLPFPDGSFDIVTCKHTLEHVEDPLGGLREIRRVLKPGGVALVVVPDGDYFKIRLWPRHARHFHPRKRGWQHHVYFSSPNLAQACSRVQLDTVCTSKAVFRRRLARGPLGPYEAIRYAFLRGWTSVCRWTRTRKELFHIVRNSSALAITGQDVERKEVLIR